MTSPVAAPPVPTTPAAPGRSRRWRWLWWIVGVAIVLTVVVLLVLAIAATASNSRPSSTVPLDPDNRGASGASALASIIDRHGVDVQVVHGIDELQRTPRPDADTTVVISGSVSTTSPVAQAIRNRVSGADRIVLIDPPFTMLPALSIPVAFSSGNLELSAAQADCQAAGISPTDTVTSDLGMGLELLLPIPGTSLCFPQGNGAYNAVVSPADTSRPTVVAITGTMTRNDTLADHDNAGVAVRAIATTDHVLWYVPQAGDTVARKSAGESDQSILPRAVGPTVLLLFFALIALAIWRGRRFGPLSAEPLPAVVKAIETTQSRGRMYRRAGASDRAAAVLRIHTIARLANYLGLPYDPGRALDLVSTNADSSRINSSTAHPTGVAEPAVSEIISVVADATGRNPGEVAALLAGPLPTTDVDLVRFTDALTALDQEVRRTL